ncbi:MAG: LytR family transcriptional regulator [Microbacterium sp. 69-7]|uniref:LCP family protein n=1 Tax=unclassified Microbacterium TaxID=2609290 RepID=UPI00086C766D|nr:MULTISPECIES: LCP family protein [unclassified Microbacterium]ODT25219.1 MAG: LytR family transcriptional regulator [Microbacterium sp. SCN 69-37]OJU44374.1 MAG: LytR family transcriptional regulator [Microbacterium sp. 69-7]
MSRTSRPVSRRVQIRRRRVTVGVLAVFVAAVIAVVAVVASDLNGIHRSDIAMPSASPGVAQNTGEVNILVMGLDSRVDQDGKPFPQEIYDAIHAEDESVGGYNTNVLMFIHIPANGGKAVGISIPRDDYVDYANAPDGVTKGKIKEDYGRTFQATYDELTGNGTDEATAYQRARDAARQAQIQTVSSFLGGVRIDHFVEVTMAAFYRVAQAVQPITVCLNQATADTFSGANFAAGMQQIDAAQAMAFVRQRRDTQYENVDLTDLDRTRRQQAFMISLAVKLKSAQTFTDFGAMRSLIDTAKQYVAIDQGFDLLSLASTAQRLAGGDITFQTLPVERFGTIDGESVNIVDQDKIAGIVRDLLNPPSPTAAPTDAASDAPSSPSDGGDGSSPSPSGSPTPQSYTNSQQPMVSGAVPCVN